MKQSHILKLKKLLKESSFIAKKAKTYDEEKNVADKAPVDDIQIKELREEVKKKTPKVKK